MRADGDDATSGNQQERRRRMETRILIADHDEKSLTGLGTLLADLHYATAMAKTLDDAAEAATRFAPDVVIVALSLAPDDDPAALAGLLDRLGRGG